MQRTSFEDMSCSVARCLDIVGEWWSLLIVRDAMLGVTRFDDFQARLGISRNILTQRLNWLVGNGVLKRVPYSEHPPRSEYRLTAKGRDLWLVVTAMREWGDRWAPLADGPPLVMRHKACGQLTTVVPTCDRCGEPLDVRSVTAAAGPGAVPGTLDRTSLAHAHAAPAGRGPSRLPSVTFLALVSRPRMPGDHSGEIAWCAWLTLSSSAGPDTRAARSPGRRPAAAIR